MQVANCQVFTLLVVVGVLMFLSSFVTLDLHTSVAELKKLPGHEFFHLPRNRAHVGNYVSSIVEPDKSQSISHSTDTKSSTISANTLRPIIKTKMEELKKKKETCSISFGSKCRINPLVKYWDEVMECYTSPLRDYIGLSAPLEDRKFVVFQPDSGGWNNIRMALEVVILFAQVTGRILVLPPHAILYLLHMNKRWGDNKASMEEYFDFEKLRAGKGLETMPMNAFLSDVAMNGLLNTSLPNNNTLLIKQPLWNYLNTACYTQLWTPGKLYIGLNITMLSDDSDTSKGSSERPDQLIGSFESTDPKRLEEFALKKKRQLLPYDNHLASQRAIYFPGAEPNRLLTHFYSMLFFATPAEEHKAKRFMRDRLRYHDVIFCTASVVIEKLLRLQRLLVIRQQSSSSSDSNSNATTGSNRENMMLATQILRYVEDHPNQAEELQSRTSSTSTTSSSIQQLEEEGEDVRSGRVLPTYVAFHIRRGDFQQKHTRLPAEQIVALTNHLVTDKGQKVAYIATDERNRSFFEPFHQAYGAVYFLSDLTNNTNIDEINQNYIGMIEQVICANADVFIGTPLSTFTAYITRIRGYMNRTITNIPISSNHLKGERVNVRQPAGLIDRSGIYERTYYFMNHHMYQLQRKPQVHFPLWIRDFVEAFAGIDDDSVSPATSNVSSSSSSSITATTGSDSGIRGVPS